MNIINIVQEICISISNIYFTSSNKLKRNYNNIPLAQISRLITEFTPMLDIGVFSKNLVSITFYVIEIEPNFP